MMMASLESALAGLRSSLAAVLLVVMPAVAAAQELEPVSVTAFPGSSTWPIGVAQQKGFFKRGGIEVKLTPTPNSVFQMTKLIDGSFDIAMTAFDNVVAYMEGQGQVPIAADPDLLVFMGGTPSMLAMTVSPDIRSYQDLKGKRLGIDAPTTGYAFVLIDLLKRNGLAPGDYMLETVGGTPGRWQCVRERKCSGALMTSPFDEIAKANGFKVLQYAADVYPHYQEPAATTRRPWAAANKGKLLSYIKGYVAAIEWLRDPANKDEAITLLRQSVPQLPPELGVVTYSAMIGPRGLAPKAQLDVEGIRQVLDLRSEYGRPKKSLRDPARYYDLTYYDAAVR